MCTLILDYVDFFNNVLCSLLLSYNKFQLL